MAIKFRCNHCQQRMSIGSKKAGHMVTCPSCGEETLVPVDDNINVDIPVSDKKSKDETSITPGDEFTNSPKKELLEKEVISNAPKFQTTSDEHSSVDSNSSTKDIYKHPWDDESSEEDFAIRKAETEFEDMDLTPMVDVTFLLLIFFMITASFSLQKTIQIPPPDPDQKGASQSVEMLEELLDESIQVDINEENQVSIDDEPLADINELASTLGEKMSVDGKSELVLTAHAASLHENVIRVIDAAKEVGMQKIRLANSGSDDDE